MADADETHGSRAVLAMDLRNDPSIVEAYRRYHRQVWPEVLASLRQAGIRRMDIYILGRRLVMILETDGRHYGDCFASHAASGPRVAEWEALMRSMQEVPVEGAHGSWWAPMELLFRLEGR